MTTPPEPIAIVGLACRFPGGANTPEELWEIVHSGRQCWSDVPEDRYNWKAFHHPSPDARGTHNARGGFFLNEDISRFDANFFGIPAAEAAAIDPQQRLLLEVSYEALENSGCSLQSIRGSDTAVYVALVSRDYDRMSYRDPSQLAKHHLTGCGDATACGRISYVFDLHGPSMSLDTGCSGGMVALHLAVQALRAGETSRAIVGGTNLLLDPDMTLAMSCLHMINDNGRSYPFDARGAGYGRGEGVAVLVLKRLTDAIEDGDSIRAVIRNSGVNQDGKTNGILMPSPEAQLALTSSLYHQAGLDPLDVSYVEAHGTGTQAGDLAEVTSIKRSFSGAAEEQRRPLFVGSIKANIGHSESTSGLAGVIKTVLALEKGIIPPLAGLDSVKPNLENLLEDSNLVIPQQPCIWPSHGRRLASVNSFGFGGTNAHVILESAPSSSARQNLVHIDNSDTSSSLTVGALTPLSDSEGDIPGEEPLSFIFSAKSKSSLEATIRNMLHWVLTHGITYRQRQQLSQALLRRSQFSWRTSIVASSYHDLLSALDDRNCRFIKVSSNPQIVFIFTGQGAQYAGMGKELLLSPESTFARSIYRSRNILMELGAQWDLVEELLRDESTSRINLSDIAQPATTAIQIALVEMLRDMGVRPAAVLGHSSGEVAAAYAAGALGHREALIIAYYKGFVAAWCKELVPSKGAMLAVGLGEEEATKFIQQKQGPGQCIVACINSPSNVTISGDEDAVIEVQKLLARASIFNRRLKVDIAYHSHHMQAVSERFRSCLDGTLTASPGHPVRFFSSVTGSEVTSPLDSAYWVDNLVSQVRFAPALVQLSETMSKSTMTQGKTALIEIGPHSALKGPARQVMSSLDGTLSGKSSYTPTLVRGEDAHLSFLRTIKNLFEQGISIPLDPGEAEPHQIATPLADLPSYAWDHTNQYWHESRLSKEYRFRSHAPHDLVGLRIPGTSAMEPVFRHILSVDDIPWLQEHIIDGFALYPGSAFLCMAIEALRQVTMDRGDKREIAKYTFRDILFSKALVIPDSPGSVEALLSLKPSSGSLRTGPQRDRDFIWEDFAISSIAETGTWNEHCRGSIRAEFRKKAVSVDAETTSAKRLHDMKAQCQESVSSETIYSNMRRNGIDYGDNFAVIRDLHVGDHQAIARIEVPDVRQIMPAQHMQPHIIHPTVFDAFMHVALPIYHRHCSQGPVMLVSVGEVSISADIAKQPGDQLLVACRLTGVGRKAGSVEVEIFQEDDQGLLIQARDLEYIYRDSSLHVPRLALHGPANDWMAATSQPGNHTKEEIADFHNENRTLQLHIKLPGLLDSAVFVPREDVKLQPDEVAVKVYAHGVNKVDVMVALDRADPTDAMLGEFAGVIIDVGSLCTDGFKPGDRVCGWGSLPYTNIKHVKRHLVQRLNESIPFTEGASIPVAFQTAYHALVTIAGLERGHSILIHGAAGAVGQAAIAIAKYLDLKIYATVGGIEKEDLLFEKKGIPKTRIFSSRTTFFKDAIMQQTGGRGIDLVLDCSSVELLQESIPIVADFGYLIDVTKSNNGLHGGLGRNITFASIDMSLLARKRPQRLAAAFEEIMHLYNAQRLTPITSTAMSIGDISDAFRIVQSQRCSGKLVLESDDTAAVRQLHPKQRQEALHLTGDGSYAVVGGSLCLNRALCDFMKRRGAKHIVSVMPNAEGEGAGNFSNTNENAKDRGSEVYR
ncbi:hypothetical protein BDW69DRAFT_202871 [Aspergillus filifer]